MALRRFQACRGRAAQRGTRWEDNGWGRRGERDSMTVRGRGRTRYGSHGGEVGVEDGSYCALSDGWRQRTWPSWAMMDSQVTGEMGGRDGDEERENLHFLFFETETRVNF